MFLFSFNDCIPNDLNEDFVISQFSKSLKSFNTIKTEFPHFIDGIITDRLPEKIYLNQNDFTLKKCFNFLDKDLFKIAIRNFGKFPIDDFYSDFNTEEILAEENITKVNNVTYDATNLRVVEIGNGILFTILLHDDLKKNYIKIFNNSQQELSVLNLYGEDNNTSFILNLIKQEYLDSLNGFDKLVGIVGEYACNNKFKANYNNLTSASQNRIISTIIQLFKRNEKTRFYPDDNKVKDVTPDSEKEIKLFELRIFEPVAIRIYFYEFGDKIYFGNVEKKPKPKVQDSDILNAISVIKELIYLNK